MDLNNQPLSCNKELYQIVVLRGTCKIEHSHAANTEVEPKLNKLWRIGAVAANLEISVPRKLAVNYLYEGSKLPRQTDSTPQEIRGQMKFL